MTGKSVDLDAGKLCDLGMITSPLWTSKFSMMEWQRVLRVHQPHFLFFLGTQITIPSFPCTLVEL